MFKFFNKILTNLKEINLFPKIKMTSHDWDKYFEEVRKNCRDKRNCIMGNFSQKGFNYVFYELIEHADRQLIFFIKDFESIFDDPKFRSLEMMCRKLNILGGIIDVYTFNGEKDERFINLEKEFKCFKYTPLSVKDENSIKKLSNFILADSNAYWLEESFTTFRRTNITNDEEFFKACFNFGDYQKTYELYDYIRAVENIINQCKK